MYLIFFFSGLQIELQVELKIIFFHQPWSALTLPNSLYYLTVFIEERFVYELAVCPKMMSYFVWRLFLRRIKGVIFKT